jgi:hypothetical protein
VNEHLPENGYYTVVIPYSETPTLWHPRYPASEAQAMTRGCFLWPAGAHAWARRRLGGQPYSVRYQRAYASERDLTESVSVIPAYVVR